MRTDDPAATVLTIPDAPDPWLTLGQSALRVQAHPATLRREIQAGHLRAARIGGRKCFRLRALSASSSRRSMRSSHAITPRLLYSNECMMPNDKAEDVGGRPDISEEWHTQRFTRLDTLSPPPFFGIRSN